MQNNKYSSLTSLFTAIAFFIVGAIIYNNPTEVVTTVSTVTGLLMSLMGAFKLTLFFKRKSKNLEVNKKDSIKGAVLLIIGLLFIFLAGAFETAIRFIIGTWILLSGINKLVSALSYGKDVKNFTSMIITSIILVLMGAYIILVSNLVISMIGVIIMVYSAIEIASYIIYKVSGIKEQEPEKQETKTEETTKETPKKLLNKKAAKEATYEEKKK